ncbi:neural/ectodermal development factor IMP-L2 [Cylas formicarius]|uniref:neural/ectodermal development factor IMP-L2 n=1 Tax=Cylas formicarius TaxID=197179 RepID=UPI002958A794|nr:neural/ectodermal development factor IMP-L2 [Cylas formicarius]
MVLSSVLLVILCLHLAHSRRLTDDIDNTVSTNAAGNLGSLDFRDQRDYVKISQTPVPVISRNVGTHVELYCEAMGSPPPTIQWYKRNMRITENESFDDSNLIDGTAGLAKVASRLVINYVLPRHQDIYRCVAEAGSQMASAITELIVPNKEGREMNFTQLVASKILGAHHMPRVTFWAPAFMDVIGSDVILPCKSVGNPKPNLMWIDPNSKIITDNEKFMVHPDGELRIRSISWNDMGVYNCIVQNSVGEDSVETFLYPMQESSK